MSMHARSIPSLPGAVAALCLCLAPACHIRSSSNPPRVVGEGLIDGHVALGIRDEDQLLRAGISLDFDRLAYLTVWKLFRAEVGLAGFSVGLGPIDVGIGTLFYDPEVPRMIGGSSSSGHAHAESGGDAGNEDTWGDEPEDSGGKGGDAGGGDVPVRGAEEPAPVRR